MDKILTYYGIIALREKLISLEDALQLGEKSFCAFILDDLFTPNGITALREGLYTKNQITEVIDKQLSLKDMLQPEALEQRRRELASESRVRLAS